MIENQSDFVIQLQYLINVLLLIKGIDYIGYLTSCSCDFLPPPSTYFSVVILII